MKSDDIGRRLHQDPVESPGTNADQIALALKQAGVQRVFGMPGGGSTADLIEAAGRIGLPFSLAHTEVGAAFMATAQAEILQKPGVCLATLGHGTFGIETRKVNTVGSLRSALMETHGCRGPALIAVETASEPYEQMIKELRG